MVTKIPFAANTGRGMYVLRNANKAYGHALANALSCVAFHTRVMLSREKGIPGFLIVITPHRLCKYGILFRQRVDVTRYR